MRMPHKMMLPYKLRLPPKIGPSHMKVFPDEAISEDQAASQENNMMLIAAL